MTVVESHSDLEKKSMNFLMSMNTRLFCHFSNTFKHRKAQHVVSLVFQYPKFKISEIFYQAKNKFNQPNTAERPNLAAPQPRRAELESLSFGLIQCLKKQTKQSPQYEAKYGQFKIAYHT